MRKGKRYRYFLRLRKSIFQSLFLPRVAEFIYIEGDNKRVSSAGIINFIYNETIVSRALPSRVNLTFHTLIPVNQL